MDMVDFGIVEVVMILSCLNMVYLSTHGGLLPLQQGFIELNYQVCVSFIKLIPMQFSLFKAIIN